MLVAIAKVQLSVVGDGICVNYLHLREYCFIILLIYVAILFHTFLFYIFFELM